MNTPGRLSDHHPRLLGHNLNILSRKSDPLRLRATLLSAMENAK
jgi:hypothetical protein